MSSISHWSSTVFMCLFDEITKAVPLRFTNWHSMGVDFARSFENMRRPAVRWHIRESFRPTFSSTLMTINTTVNNHKSRPYLKNQNKTTIKRNCRKSSSSSAGESNQPSINPEAYRTSIPGSRYRIIIAARKTVFGCGNSMHLFVYYFLRAKLLWITVSSSSWRGRRPRTLAFSWACHFILVVWSTS